MHSELGWGILGTGAIARTMASALAKSRGGKLVAVASRHQQHTADRFGQLFQLNPRQCYCTYDGLLIDPAVQAVYIATPHTAHAHWAIKAAAAGKHVLVEKPIATNYEEAKTVIDAARQNHVLLMEAFMYRCHPQTLELVNLIKTGRIGDLRIIQATNSFDEPFDPANRLFDPSLGGGSILDIGCYPMSMARLLAGAAIGSDFADPLEVTAVGHIGPGGVDHYTVAAVRFPGDILAQLSAGISVNQENIVRLFGTRGKITVPFPWVDSYTIPHDGRILIEAERSAPQEINIPATVNSFTYEVDLFADCVVAGRTHAPSPAMSWADSLSNMCAIDRWRTELDAKTSH